MKVFCEHHQPWFKCGVCANEREQDEKIRWRGANDAELFLYRMLAGYSLLPTLSCRIQN